MGRAGLPFTKHLSLRRATSLHLQKLCPYLPAFNALFISRIAPLNLHIPHANFIIVDGSWVVKKERDWSAFRAFLLLEHAKRRYAVHLGFLQLDTSARLCWSATGGVLQIPYAAVLYSETRQTKAQNIHIEPLIHAITRSDRYSTLILCSRQLSSSLTAPLFQNAHRTISIFAGASNFFRPTLHLCHRDDVFRLWRQQQ